MNSEKAMNERIAGHGGFRLSLSGVNFLLTWKQNGEVSLWATGGASSIALL